MMDPKASAKAKRSHTQQGRKSHPTPADIARKKKAAPGQSGEKASRPPAQTLLSNSDRYDDGKEEWESAQGSALAGGEIAPKSKGADFAHLIEQARSQQHETKAPAVPESMPFFDEIALDFMQGVSSIRTVRGKNILSRCEDDNFVVDDDLTPSFEVPYLNLDLHALDAQLSKIKLSERLFIEPDLFPEDLCLEESKGSTYQTETLGAIDVGQNLDASYYLPHSSPANDFIAQAEDHNINAFSYSDSSRICSDLGNVQGTGGDAEESLAKISKSSTMQVGEAEAELDVLLESFSETNLSSSNHGKLLDTNPVSKISFHDSISMNWKSKVTDAGLINRTQPAEAQLDNLLNSSKETFPFGSIHGSLLNSSNFKAQNSNFLGSTHQQSSIRDQAFLNRKSTTSLDDSIDSLLAETSPTLKMQKHASSIDDLLAITSVSRARKSPISSNDPVSSIGSGDMMDDFDSWIDTV